MKRAIFAFIAGLLAWVLTGSLLFRGLRVVIAGYTAAEPQMHFTTGMMVARLACAFIMSLAAGAVMGALAPSSTRVPWVLGAVLLAGFLPVHVKLWNNFPIWYHAAFLVTLVPLLMLGARLTGSRRASTPTLGVTRPS